MRHTTIVWLVAFQFPIRNVTAAAAYRFSVSFLVTLTPMMWIIVGYMYGRAFIYVRGTVAGLCFRLEKVHFKL